MFGPVEEDLIHKRTTVAQVLDAMAMGAKAGTDERGLYQCMARKVRELVQRCADLSADIEDAWDNIGVPNNRNHLTLGEQVGQLRREADGFGNTHEDAAHD